MVSIICRPINDPQLWTFPHPGGSTSCNAPTSPSSAPTPALWSPRRAQVLESVRALSAEVLFVPPMVSLKSTECEPFAHEGRDHCALPRGWEDSPWSCSCIQRLDTEKELVVTSSVDKICCCKGVAREAVKLRSLPEMWSFWSSWCSVAQSGRCSVAQVQLSHRPTSYR